MENNTGKVREICQSKNVKTMLPETKNHRNKHTSLIVCCTAIDFLQVILIILRKFAN